MKLILKTLNFDDIELTRRELLLLNKSRRKRKINKMTVVIV